MKLSSRLKRTVGGTLLFCFGVVTGFLALSATVTYSVYRKQEVQMASDYLQRVRTYAYWQYKQADQRHARQSLERYLRRIQWLRTRQVRGLDRQLAFEAALTNLRLYHLASNASNTPDAERYMKAAQEESKRLGMSDTSSEHLSKVIEIRESKESQADKEGGLLPASSQQGEK